MSNDSHHSKHPSQKFRGGRVTCGSSHSQPRSQVSSNGLPWSAPPELSMAQCPRSKGPRDLNLLEALMLDEVRGIPLLLAHSAPDLPGKHRGYRGGGSGVVDGREIREASQSCRLKLPRLPIALSADKPIEKRGQQMGPSGNAEVSSVN